MNVSSHNRQQRHRGLRGEVDQAINSDRRFFKRRPDRSYRVRQAFPAEAEFTALVNGFTSLSALPIGIAIFVAVRQIEPGVRLQLFFLSTEGDKPDLLSESKCRERYHDLARSHKGREIERAFKRSLRKRGRQ